MPFSFKPFGFSAFSSSSDGAPNVPGLYNPVWAVGSSKLVGGGLGMSFKINTAVNGFSVHFKSIGDGSDLLTGTPIGYYKLDTGNQLPIADTAPVFKGRGQWDFNLLAGELNGAIVGLVFTHPLGLTEHVTIKTVPKLVSDLQDIAVTEIVSAGAITTLSGAVTNVSNLSNLPSIPTNWITSDGVAANALDGKGNWNVGKTGYTLSQTFPTNFSDLEIEATTGKVNTKTCDTVTDGAKSSTALSNANWTTARAGYLDNINNHVAQTANHTTNIANINSKLDAMQGATFDTATDSLVAIRDRGDAAWTTGAGGTPPDLLQSTTINSLTSPTVFTLSAGSSDDDAYAGQVIVITDATNTDQKAVVNILSYVGATKTVTLANAPAFATSVNDNIEILAATGAAGSGATASEVWGFANRSITDKSGFTIAGTKTTLDDLTDATPPTAAAIVNEWEAQSQADPTGFHVNVLEVSGTTQTGGDVVGLVNAVPTNAELNARTLATNDYATQAKQDAAANINTEARLSELDSATSGKMANQVDLVKTDSTAILLDTSTTLDTKLNTITADVGSNASQLASLITDLDAVLVDTSTTLDGKLDSLVSTLGTAGSGLTDIGGLSTVALAEILVEVNKAFDAPIPELPIGVPPATPSARVAMMLGYMALRNTTITQTSEVDALEIHNDAGQKIASKLLEDDGSDLTESKMISG